MKKFIFWILCFGPALFFCCIGLGIYVYLCLTDEVSILSTIAGVFCGVSVLLGPYLSDSLVLNSSDQEVQE